MKKGGRTKNEENNEKKTTKHPTCLLFIKETSTSSTIKESPFHLILGLLRKMLIERWVRFLT